MTARGEAGASCPASADVAIGPRPQVAALDGLRAVGAEIRARADVTTDRRGERGPVSAADHDGVARCTSVGAERQRIDGGAGREPSHGGGRQLGRIDRHDQDRGRVRGCHGIQSRPEGGRDTLGPRLGAHDGRAFGDEWRRIVGRRAEDHDDRVAPPVAQRPDGLLDPRDTVGIAREGLGTAEATTGPGGEDEARRAVREDVDEGLGKHGHGSVACVKHGADSVAGMLELAADLLPLLEAGTPVAAVTVTRVIRSAPRGVGATLAVTADARVIGSLSGGCVEGDAVMLGLDALRTGDVRRGSFGFAGPDDAIVTAGLACGGAIEVVAYPIDGTDPRARAALQRAAAGRESAIDLDLGDGTTLELRRRSRPRLIVLGAGEHAAALCRVGAAAGFAVTVCDAWALLVTRERFPEASDLVVASPHEYLASLEDPDERTAVCVLTHDERLDVPAIRTALRLPVGFVGAMGSRATVARRAALLTQAGVTDAELGRLHSPLGLDLGAETPEETALSVIAEIVAARRGASALPLSATDGPLHAGAAAPGCAVPTPVIAG